jgi:hypothetical protein
MHKSLMLSASLGLALVSTAPARADICFEYSASGGGVGIALGAKVPAAPNTCDRVTVVGATGLICRSQEGGGAPTLVYQYSLTSCTTPYFEAASCRLRLEDNSDLPSKNPPRKTAVVPAWQPTWIRANTAHWAGSVTLTT